MNSYGKEENCVACIYNIKRPDMKDIHWCIKRNFPILNLDIGCAKFKRRRDK